MVDSLEVVLKQTKQDTSRVSLLAKLSEECRLAGEMEKAHAYAAEGIALSKKISDPAGLATCYNRLGNNFLVQGEYTRALAYYDSTKAIWDLRIRSEDKKVSFRAKKGIAIVLGNMGLAHQYLSDNAKALEYQMKSLKIREEMNDRPGMGTTLGNIGLIYFYLADYPKALDYQLRSLKIEEELKNDLGVARTLGNIGGIYLDIADYTKALEYQFRCLKMSEKIGNKQYVGNTLTNIGAIYQDMHNFPKALEFQKRSLKINEEIGDKRGMSIAMNNIGSIYAALSDSECVQVNIPPSERNALSLEYQRKSLKISEEIGDKQNQAVVLTNMSNVFLEQKNYSLAFEHGNRAYAISHEIGDLYNEKDILLILYKANKATGNTGKALELYEKYILVRDSIVREEKQKDIMKQHMEYEFEKKEATVKAEHEKKAAVASAETRKQKIISWSVAAGLLLVVVFSVFMFNRWRVTQQQKKVIEEQKALVDEKNRHITDSINYAKRIQESLLLSEEEIGKTYPFETFVFYRPKDIVSGDFYWLSAPGSLPGDAYVVAAADCTGHGVPGAFLSMIGNMLLNEVVHEKKLTDPSAILRELHEGMYQALHHGNEASRSQDGMDIAICTIDREKNRLRYAGACSPLYIVYKEEDSFRLEICKPDVLSIGDKAHFNSGDVSFSSQEVALRPGMRLYLFSDGYMDQFNRKLKQRIGSKQFQQHLLDSAALSMSEQKEYLSKILADWMGADKQVDDVLVIGIKI